MSSYFLCFSQMNSDEILRKKTLIDYLDHVSLEYSTPEAEAIANITIKVFKENLIILEVNSKISNDVDALKLESLKLAFKNLLEVNTPSWSEILALEREKLILQDKQVSRKSKYAINQ